MARVVPDDHSVMTGLTTPEGALPLTDLSVDAHVHGLAAHVHVRQTFVNRLDRAIEATYVHPLPDRAAVTGFRMTVADRVVEGVLKERGAAREEYDTAIAQGHRAAIAEENRPDVFSMRVGNIQPGETATVDLDLVGRLPVDDGHATFHYPLVVAPRYIPGSVLDGRNVGDGIADDTDAVPDASTISPPVLIPGAPNPVRLALAVTIDPAGLDVHDLRSSLHDVVIDEQQDRLRVELRPGERVDRDFILRFAIAGADLSTSVVCVPDEDASSGTWMATVVPPEATAPAPRDVVLVLDRSGSMQGWKMIAARRAAARIVDSLRSEDRFAVIAFDTVIDTPPDLDVLVQATDRNRFAAVEFLARLDARGGTVMLPALQQALHALSRRGRGDDDRESTIVLVTDGQVGNEDQILAALDAGLRYTRLFTVGIDRAVNAGFLRRLAAAGAGRCDLVESEDRLDDVMTQLHRRIAGPVLLDVTARIDGVEMLADTVTPVRSDCFAGVPLVIAGRYTGQPSGTATLTGTDDLSRDWSAAVTCSVDPDAALSAVWARAHVRDLEDRYAVAGGGKLAGQIVATSIGFGVLSRFTAFVAVDRSEVVGSTDPVRVIQPVEQPSGWTPVPAMHRYRSPAPAAAPPMPGSVDTAAESFLDMELDAVGAPMAQMPAASGRSRRSTEPALDRYVARRDVLMAQIREAVTGNDVEQARRLLRTLRMLRDDLASIDVGAAALDDLQTLIDALVEWIDDPTPATAGLVTVAIDVLEPLSSAAHPRDRSRFWR
jgi:Ca-activated chloride channel family protein